MGVSLRIFSTVLTYLYARILAPKKASIQVTYFYVAHPEQLACLTRVKHFSLLLRCCNAGLVRT
jgi:hypothetical protein